MTTARILPFRMLLDEGVKLTRSRLRQLYLPFVLPMVLISVLTVALQAGMMQRMSVGDFAGGCAAGAGMMLVAVLSLLVYVAMGVAALDVVAERPVDFRRAFTFALQPRAFGTLVLVGLLILASYIACLLPVLYVLPLLSFCLPAMVEEGTYGRGAIERSVELAGLNPLADFPRNPLMRAFALVVVGMVLSMAVSLLIQMPFEILRQVWILRDIGVGDDPFAVHTSPASLGLQLLGSVLGVLASTVLSLYISHCTALLYHDTRRRREGGDLEQALEALGRMAPATGSAAGVAASAAKPADSVLPSPPEGPATGEGGEPGSPSAEAEERAGGEAGGSPSGPPKDSD